MQVAAITGPRQSAIIDVPDPRIRENFARVKILVAPMCTEYKSYQAGQLSQALGHEAAGEVVEVAQPGRVKAGDRVVMMPQYPCGRCALCLTGDYIHCEQVIDPLKVCDSATGTATYAQYAIKQDWLLLPIPDAISTEHASMACCGLGPTFGAMQRMAVTAGETVLIVGLGPVGLGGVINARYRGARVIGVDSHPYRTALAQRLGAEAVIDPHDPEALSQLKALTHGIGVDVAIDCTAVPAAQQFALQATRRRGQVGFVGWGGHIALDNMIPEGLTLHGCWHWNLRDTPRLLRTIGAVGGQLDQLITHTFPLSQVHEAWELQLTGNCGKVLLTPHSA
ncbi:MAG TPA: zinc-binding dehydrogenase [Armatimonadota bacterium]|jgi:threonine dehydrogenase-like Zn-dependent dehydrogenase